MGRIELLNGDCIELLKALDENSIDSIVTDPPYGLGFMGKAWDKTGIAFRPAVWVECLRVLKPGGHLLAFGGSRTFHRIAVAIEDAGFEIRDTIMWLYGSGFPKSHNISKAIDALAGAEREVVGHKIRGDVHKAKLSGVTMAAAHANRNNDAIFGYGVENITKPATPAAAQFAGFGTALKPAHEPIILARKPLQGTVAENVLQWGTGGLNVDGCRVETADITGRPVYESKGWKNTSGMTGSITDDWQKGRWPANIIHDGSAEVVAGFPETTSGSGIKTKNNPYSSNITWNASNTPGQDKYTNGDTGSAARFFKECPQDNDIYLLREGCYNGFSESTGEHQWQDQNQRQSSAGIAEKSLSLQSALESIVQKVAATLPSLAGIVSSDLKEHSILVTLSELKTIEEACITAMTTIACGFSPESQLRKHTQCGSLVSVAAAKNQTGITTITASLLRLDGYAENATLSIIQTNLELGEKACRFKYCAKASKADRDEGLEYFRQVKGHSNYGSIQEFSSNPARANHHPTVKPTALMRYLCKLVTPPGGIVLDPFMGSGSTGKAAILEGFRFVGIEREAEYLEIALARINHVAGVKNEPEETESKQSAISKPQQAKLF